MSVISASRSFVEVARDRNITLLAAGVAYYAFSSVIPLFILLLALTSAFGGQDLIAALLARIGAASPAMATLLERALSDQAGRVGASLVGTAALVWSALKVFRGIDDAFDEIYENYPDDGPLAQAKKAVIVVAAIAVSAVLIGGLAAAVNVVFSLGVPYPNLVSGLVLFAALTLLLFPVYYVMPPIDVSVGHVVPGTIVASAGLVVLQWAFVYYVGNAGRYATYGVLGAMLLFVTWLYVAGIVLLAGAVVNLVFEFPGGRVPAATVASE
ncbi:MAG: YihY/virulence factor BrkB family protein [Salinigranum sp.]